MLDSAAEAQVTYQNLYHFSAPVPIPATPGRGSDGALYGTTDTGGAGRGVVYRVGTNGKGYVVLHEFGGTDGKFPTGRLLASGGALFGTTRAGGTWDAGVVFRMNQDGTGLTILHEFADSSEGRWPTGGLVADALGFYGTTTSGGQWGLGVVFAVGENGSFEVLHSFAGSDGAQANGGLAIDRYGRLWGTTALGGGSNMGVVFRCQGVSCQVVHEFAGPDGARPTSGLFALGDFLYGTTEDGGASDNGVLFRISASDDSFSLLREFEGADGAHPTAALAATGGLLYGTTAGGGSRGMGVVFKIGPDGSGFRKVRDFRGGDGAVPSAGDGLAVWGGVLYGATASGGTSNVGIVYQVSTDGSRFARLHDFEKQGGVATPDGGIISAGGVFYGASLGGGTSAQGTVIKVKPDGTGAAVLHEFHGKDGAYPADTLVASGSALFGVTNVGGSLADEVTGNPGGGVVYRVNQDGTGFTVLHEFAWNGPDGFWPRAALVMSQGVLYGTTEVGGPAGCGTVFKLNLDGTGYQVLHQFDRENGCYPGALISSGGWLYGASSGSMFGAGTIFKIAEDGSGFATLHEFNWTDGAYPWGPLVASHGLLYGTTAGGRTDDAGSAGTVFSITPDGAQFRSLYDFRCEPAPGGCTRGETGAFPAGHLAMYRGALFGTSSGVANKYALADGYSTAQPLPDSPLVEGVTTPGSVIGEGVLYGTTYMRGGDFDGGVLFSLALPPSTSPPGVSVNSPTAVERAGSAAEFRVTLEWPSSQVITVDYATADGTASAGADYVATAGRLTFLPGEDSKRLRVPVNTDSVQEGPETFSLDLANPTNAALTVARGTARIIQPRTHLRGGTSSAVAPRAACAGEPLHASAATVALPRLSAPPMAARADRKPARRVLPPRAHRFDTGIPRFLHGSGLSLGRDLPGAGPPAP